MNQPTDENWRNATFRQQVRNKLEETFKTHPSGARDINALENTIYSNSKSREEYIKNTFKVLQCVKDGYNKQRQSQAQPSPMPVNQDMVPTASTATQDPMSALQSLVSFPAADNQTTLIKTIPVNNSMHDQSNMIGVTVTPANIALAGGHGGHGGNQIQVTAQPMQQISQMQMQQINASQGGIQIQAMGTNQPHQIQMTTISTGGPQMVHHQQQQQQHQQQQQQQQQVQQQQHLQQHPHRIGLQQNRMQVNQMMVQQSQMPGRPPMMQRVQRHAPPNMTIQAQMQPATDTQFYQTQSVQHRPLQQPINQQQQPQQQQQQQQQPQPPQPQPQPQPQSQPQIQPQIQHFQQSPQMPPSNMMVDQGPIPPQMHPMHQGPPSNQMHVTMTPSQSQFVPSPSQGIMPSPMSVGMMQGRGPGSIASIPSPGQLNTPQMIQQTSPAQRHMSNDEQAYQEKLKQLQRFIIPLKARLDREENEKKNNPVKIKNLLAIISDSGSRVTMELLNKCELLLEKMGFDGQATNQQIPMNHQQPPKFIGQQGGSQMTSDHNIGQPLIDALLNNIKKPFFNHSLHRTFSRAVCSLSNGTQR